MSYFGGIIGIWELTKYVTGRLMLHMGLGPTWPITRTRSTATDATAPVPAEAVPVPVPEPVPVLGAAVARATTGTILFTFVGEKYHTRRNCGHVVGRKTTSYAKCLDCARLDD